MNGPIPLTGVVFCSHFCAWIVPHTHSNNSDVIGASRLKSVQQKPGFVSQILPVHTGHKEVVLLMLHHLWRGPGEVDGLHSLRRHTNGARRGGYWMREGNTMLVFSSSIAGVLGLIHACSKYFTCAEMHSRLTCCIANFRTVSVELVDMGDHHNAVKHSWFQVKKRFA